MVRAPAQSAGGPTLLWWGVGIAVLVIVLAVAALAWWLVTRDRRAPRRDLLWVANTSYVDRVPAVTQLMRRYRVLQASLGVMLLVAVVAVGALASRPARSEVVSEQMRTRDIVLCLDVSGSMAAFDGQIFTIFSELVDSFDGERIALSIFNSSSRTVFPLTDDYALVQDQLAEGVAAMDKDPAEFDFDHPGKDAREIKEYLQFTAGTLASDAGGSLVGDGLANCAGLFDHQDSARSRSIILATDNFVSGKPIYTLDQAATLVTSKGISLHGIWADTDPGGYLGYESGGGKAEFESVITGHSGLFFTADSPHVVEPIVEKVVADQATELDAVQRTVVTDTPRWWFFLALGAVGSFCLIAWRVRE